MSAWRVEFAHRAAKAVRKLDKGTQKRIFAKLNEVAALDDPRVSGKALQGNLAGYWSWRAGDFRIIASIEHQEVLILVVDVAHRSRIYDQ